MKWIKESLINKEKISLSDVIKREGHKFNLLKELASTEQDLIWHSEGNVFIHTQMVINETYKIFNENKFSLEEKYVLLMAAIFHDIAKPLVTKTKFLEHQNRDCVIAPNHEIEGVSYLFHKFLEEDMSESETKAILELVGYHQKPKLLVIKNENEWQYKYLTRNISGKLFYFHELADMKGRICEDMNVQLGYLDEFKMFCEEYGCFENRSHIYNEVENIFKNMFSEDGESLEYITCKAISDLSTKKIEDPIVAYQKYYEKKDNFPTLYILCAPSGSGKSTAIEKIKKEECIIVSLDEIRKNFKQNNTNRKEVEGRVKQQAKLELKKALTGNKDIFYDATSLRKDFRKIICDLGRDYNALVCLVFVHATKNECISSDRNRSVRTVGKDIIEKQFKMFQYPEDIEFDKSLIFSRKNNELTNKTRNCLSFKNK